MSRENETAKAYDILRRVRALEARHGDVEATWEPTVRPLESICPHGHPPGETCADCDSDVVQADDATWAYSPDQPRGETVPGTNSGSFAPAGGGGKGGDSVHEPDPHADHNGDGVTDCARVGVCGDAVPDRIPRLPNLTRTERNVESKFADAYERDPANAAGAYLDAVTSRAKDSNVFSTDDAKAMSPEWNHDKASRALFNTAVHQTANAIAKRAFLMRLDEIAKGPPEKRTVLVTAGGCAAGKGYCLKTNESTRGMIEKFGAVWDTAGEQNSTELPWVQREAEKRGLSATYVYVDADPIKDAAPRMVKRQNEEGRIVDALAFADSYTVGAKNFQAFHERTSDKADFIFLTSRGGQVRQIDSVPKEAIAEDHGAVYRAAVQVMNEKGSVPARIGGTAHRHVWPKAIDG